MASSEWANDVSAAHSRASGNPAWVSAFAGTSGEIVFAIRHFAFLKESTDGRQESPATPPKRASARRRWCRFRRSRNSFPPIWRDRAAGRRSRTGPHSRRRRRRRWQARHVGFHVACDIAADAFAERERRDAGQVVGDDDKLLAAEAEHGVAWPHRRRDDAHDALQHDIARGVAEAIVEALEVIDVDDEQAQRPAGKRRCSCSTPPILEIWVGSRAASFMWTASPAPYFRPR